MVTKAQMTAIFDEFCYQLEPVQEPKRISSPKKQNASICDSPKDKLKQKVHVPNIGEDNYQGKPVIDKKRFAQALILAGLFVD